MSTAQTVGEGAYDAADVVLAFRPASAEQPENLRHVRLGFGIRRDAAEPANGAFAGVVRGQRERQLELVQQLLRYFVPASMLLAGSYGLRAWYWRAVFGISCIRPIAPFDDRARG